MLFSLCHKDFPSCGTGELLSSLSEELLRQWMAFRGSRCNPKLFVWRLRELLQVLQYSTLYLSFISASKATFVHRHISSLSLSKGLKLTLIFTAVIEATARNLMPCFRMKRWRTTYSPQTKLADCFHAGYTQRMFLSNIFLWLTKDQKKNNISQNWGITWNSNFSATHK